MNPNRFDDTPNPGPNRGPNNTEITGNKNYSTNQNTQPQDSGNPTHSDGFTMIPPNVSKRDKLLNMSQKELDDLQRLKEELRAGPIQLAPERLGGTVALSEARERQQTAGHQSKLQKKLKREEMNRRRKQAEEEENQRMKAIQREKEKRSASSKARAVQLSSYGSQQLQTYVILGKTKAKECSTLGHEYREGRKAQEQVILQQKKDEQRKKSQILEEKHQQEEEDRKSQMEKERLRVNSAFLDSLEAKGSGRASELLPCTPELGNVYRMREPQDPAPSPVSFPSQLHTDSAEEEDADREWVVMKLQSMFSYYEQENLEDIVSQCNGNFQRAYDLLNA
ncbi:Epithelial-stromal interaction protein 1 [Bagarius yarrelli]|uniref:Epithelial-stromal interaction protein 1 n=1 Tax=Bagarius yarrelli TaxID=175774 RepID=A0A556TXM3_BAGYA|nr:Epithelial-stromal interaction protein 1 [Bagarius yarrelli]